MTLPERLAQIEAELTRVAQLRDRALASLNEASTQLVRLDAQKALLKELIDGE